MPKSGQDDGPVDEQSTACETAKVLAANLAALMERNKAELGSNPKLGKKTGLGASAVSRLRAGHNATLETLEALAKVFEVAPWQLLVPGLKPDNLPTLAPVSEQERKLYERLREVVKEVKEGT